MFYKILKNFFLKKNVKKRLLNQPLLSKQQKIKTIGVLVDESYFSHTSSLLEEILKEGFVKDQVKVLIYKDKIRSKEEVIFLVFPAKIFRFLVRLIRKKY